MKTMDESINDGLLNYHIQYRDKDSASARIKIDRDNGIITIDHDLKEGTPEFHQHMARVYLTEFLHSCSNCESKEEKEYLKKIYGQYTEHKIKGIELKSELKRKRENQ